MNVGVTGTRNGCTVPQLDSLARELAKHLADSGSVLHHGCCVGADWQAVMLARKCLRGVYVVGHPGDWPALQSREAIAASNEMRQFRPNLQRNRDIVDECERIIACPAGPEVVRSGTWSTIRYAIGRNKPVLIVWPDGSTEQR